MIAVEIDELTPCLKDNNTGAILETEDIRIKRKNWDEIENVCSIFWLNRGYLSGIFQIIINTGNRRNVKAACKKLQSGDYYERFRYRQHITFQL